MSESKAIPRVGEHVEYVTFGRRSVDLLRGSKRVILLPEALPPRFYLIERVRLLMRRLRLLLPAKEAAVLGGRAPDTSRPSVSWEEDNEGEARSVGGRGENSEP